MDPNFGGFHETKYLAQQPSFVSKIQRNNAKNVIMTGEPGQYNASVPKKKVSFLVNQHKKFFI